MISFIKIPCDKERKIKSIEKELKKMFIFEIKNAVEVEESGLTYLACTKPGCCGLKLNPGPILHRQ